MSWRKAAWIRGLAVKGRGLELNFCNTHIRARHGSIPVTSVPSHLNSEENTSDLVKTSDLASKKVKGNLRLSSFGLYMGKSTKHKLCKQKGKKSCLLSAEK